MAGQEIKKLSDFPAVEKLLQSKSLALQIKKLPRPVATSVIQATIRQAKQEFKTNKRVLTLSGLNKMIIGNLKAKSKKEVCRVINATGIPLHTNLGRAPLGESVLKDIRESLAGYSNLEFDLETGNRGKRGEACEQYLAQLSGAESAAVVNNCAAALFIILNTFALRKNVILSRGEMVQIGGGFRIPEILKRSGAKLTEIGATNITTADDYSQAIDKASKVILKVHRSNFQLSGFTKEVSAKELAQIARQNELILVNDLGSGALFPTKKLFGHNEPTVQQSVRDGAHLTCFSGDKMPGGVQAGLIVGKKELIDKIKNNPLFRAVRVDKITFLILEKLFKTYLDNTYQENIKIWQLLAVTESELYSRAKSIIKQLGNPAGLSAEVTSAFLGGGGMPETELPSAGLIFSPDYPASKLLKKLRSMNPPVIARIENDKLIVDLKAVDRSELDLLTKSLQQILK
ncbi:MAG: L-seryl-tRNA(Sec) selenium transferase [candidate division Zixibacteria bacterium]|nr:L-seryl-tRNA(Sec) selenium transferase [candidate division Zixibacteria bacterium]